VKITITAITLETDQKNILEPHLFQVGLFFLMYISAEIETKWKQVKFMFSPFSIRIDIRPHKKKG
jgi:hypothetical protein